MRNTSLLLALLALLAVAAGIGWAQQELPPATDEGPLTTRPVAKQQAAPAPAPPAAASPFPDAAPPAPADGVYSVGPGVVSPRLLDLVTLPYPDDAPPADLPRICTLSLVIGADGVPSQIRVMHSLNSVVDQYVVDSTKKMHFDPGIVSGQPVPVRIGMSFHFATDTNSARPRIMAHAYSPARAVQRAFDKPPKPTHWAEAEYSDEARRKKIQGVVMVSVLVTEDGMPTDARVEKGLGYGLDQSALECVSRYRFIPATRDGQPIAARITIEVSFRLY